MNIDKSAATDSGTSSAGMFAEIHKMFNNRRTRKILMKVRVPFGLALAGALVYFAKPDWFWPALGICLFGEFIQLWCFACLDKKGTLAFNGLYKYVRNPMYLGRFFIVLGFLLLLKQWYVIPVLVVLYWFYMYNRVRREEKVLVKIFGQSYHDYCKSVNRFLPSWRSAERGRVFFWEWRLLLQNNGILNFIAVLLMFTIVYVRLRG